jgi:hypothetical protein
VGPFYIASFIIFTEIFKKDLGENISIKLIINR